MKIWKVTGRAGSYEVDWYASGFDPRTGDGSNEGPFPRWRARLLVWWYNRTERRP